LDVTTAATGKEALRSLENDQFDLVLSDVDLPDVTGLEICKQLKQDSKRQHTAVIIMSGRLAEDMECLALGSGAIDFISKPFEAKIVLAKIFAQISKGKIAN
jgi:DNA-binding response OmpR family regulator